MVVVPSGYEVGELANKHFFASLCARPNLARREIERGATPLTDRENDNRHDNQHDTRDAKSIILKFSFIQIFI